MRTTLFVYLIFVAIISVLPFYIYFKKKTHKSTLIKWRKTLHSGMIVLVDDGAVKFIGVVVRVFDDYVRVLSDSGHSGSFGMDNIYPPFYHEEN